MTHMLQQAMIGKRVVGVTRIHDYAQLLFNDHAVLSIYNKYIGDLNGLMNKTVISMEKAIDKWIIEFSDGLTLQIGMADDDFNGPEAFALVDEKAGVHIVEQGT